MSARVLGPVLLLGAFVLAWQAVAGLGGVDDLLLASPLESVEALVTERALLLDNAAVTGLEMVAGLAIAIVAGVAGAVLTHLVPPLRDAAAPLIVASQAVPIPVLAPLFVLLFDYGVGPKLAIVALVCFFPITVNVLAGLRGVDPKLLALMRTLGASRLATLVKVEGPAALPRFFTGLRLAATFSAIGAVFAEWAGAERGLGRLVLLGLAQLQTPRVYAGVLLLAAMAITLYALVALAERHAVPWTRREETT